MSIIMGLIGKDGIVLAADSRTTWQKSGFTYHNDNAKKLHKLTDNIGLMTCGYNSGYQHFLVDYYNRVYMRDMSSNIKKLKNGKELPEDFELSYLEIVQSFAKAIRTEIKPFVDSCKTLKLAGGMDFVLAGYDSNGIAKIYSIDVYDPVTPFAPRECEKYHFSGVNEIGMYWVRKLDMNNLNLPVAFLKKFVVMVSLETIKTDDMCGEPIQMAIIDNNGYQDVSNEVDSIKANLDSKNKWLFDYLDK